jgi:hypothetical protein
MFKVAHPLRRPRVVIPRRSYNLRLPFQVVKPNNASVVCKSGVDDIINVTYFKINTLGSSINDVTQLWKKFIPSHIVTYFCKNIVTKSSIHSSSAVTLFIDDPFKET